MAFRCWILSSSTQSTVQPRPRISFPVQCSHLTCLSFKPDPVYHYLRANLPDMTNVMCVWKDTRIWSPSSPVAVDKHADKQYSPCKLLITVDCHNRLHWVTWMKSSCVRSSYLLHWKRTFSKKINLLIIICIN